MLKRLIRKARNRLISSIAVASAPRMMWGYQDVDGWRSRTRLSSSVVFLHRENIRIEDNVFVWHYSILDGTGGLIIGTGSQIGAWVGIFTHSSHISIRLLGEHYQDVPEFEKPGYIVKPVRIGRYVFVGAGARILPGVTIGDEALVVTGAVVSKDVEPKAMVAGNPAKVIGTTAALDARYKRGSLGAPSVEAEY